MVEDVNEAPDLIGDTEIDYLENGVEEVIEYTATDPEGDDLEWEPLSGDDSGAFTFSDGKLEFVSPPDYENATDGNGDNAYEVVVTVIDEALATAVPVTVTVTDDNEPFTLEGDTAFDYDENDTFAVGTFSVVDDPENGPIEWSLSGADRGDFTIDNGVLEFAAVPDYENAVDSNRDNRYHVTVSAFDGVYLESLSAIVTVTDLDEPGEVTVPYLRPQVGRSFSATLAEPDRGVVGLTWSWDSSSGSAGPWDVIAGASSRSYMPQTADEGVYLRVTASYDDTHGTGRTLRAVSTDTVRAAPLTNRPPEFTEDGMRSIEENTVHDMTTGRWVGLPVTATDPDTDDDLGYSLSGRHARFFEIDPRSGQLRTATELDHESGSSYSVTVTATDLSGRTASIPVTIAVTNVEEDGAVSFSTGFPKTGETLTATLADPDGGVSGATWEWHRSLSGFGGWDLIEGADSRLYRPVDEDLEHYLRATVQYTDRHDPQLQEVVEAVTLATVSESVGPRPDPRPGPGPGPGGGGGGGGSPGGGGGGGGSPGGGSGGGGGFGGGGGSAGGGGSPGLGSGPAERPQERFTDVRASSMHAASIDALLAAGITGGCSTEPLRFCPKQPVTRAQMATFLTRALNLAQDARPAGFTDVSPSSIHATSIDALQAAGITGGCSTEPLRFCPKQPVTRAQMATFLTRALNLAQDARPAGFTDVSPSSTHAANIDALQAAGITGGCSTEPLRFCPDRPVTRAQMATFIIRLLNYTELV